MRSLKLLVLGLAALPLSAWAGAGISGSVSAEISPWKASCSALLPGQSASCSPPSADSASPQGLLTPLQAVNKPGQAGQSSSSFSIPSLSSAQAYQGALTYYSVIPAPSTGTPPYVQVQLELIAPERAVCIESVRWDSPMEFPPLSCSAFDTGSATQWGVTVVFQEK